MKRFFLVLLVLLVCLCACSMKKGYNEETQRIINTLYSLKTAGEDIQKHYNQLDKENQTLMLEIIEKIYQANAREYALAIAQLKITSVVLPEDLPETLPDFQK